LNRCSLLSRLKELRGCHLPLPGEGNTAERLRRLLELGRENLSLARLAEAHFDALAILAEAGRSPMENALYGVWASERPGSPLKLRRSGEGWSLNGVKMFASGAGIVDRALITVEAPNPYLMDIDLLIPPESMRVETSGWKSPAFQATNTATITFIDFSVNEEALIGGRNFYLDRPGFWHGACGPAACWAGGAMGLVDYARVSQRSDPHTLAHLGAMTALEWSMCNLLAAAGREIDEDPSNLPQAHIRALSLRHLVEQAASEILSRFGRAYGPHPLVADREVSDRCMELELYLRQCHAERDLAALGEKILAQKAGPLSAAI
jgi:alkylation response protein AidB-like acyl-CoA dehydrogenase